MQTSAGSFAVVPEEQAAFEGAVDALGLSALTAKTKSGLELQEQERLRLERLERKREMTRLRVGRLRLRRRDLAGPLVAPAMAGRGLVQHRTAELAACIRVHKLLPWLVVFLIFKKLP